MKGRIRTLSLLLLTICLTAGPVSIAGAITFDLKTDWSTTTNPNGVWSYNQGTTVLPLQTDYDSSHTYVNLHAWAYEPYPANGHVPVWIQAPSDGFWGGDFKQDDIVMHPTSSTSSYPYGEGNVTWTSNLTGVATISGNVWYGELYPGRSVDWALTFNGSGLAGGKVFYGDSYNRTNPETFGAFIQNVKPGDVLMFQGITTPGVQYPWFIGVNLTIDVTPSAPLPASAWLFGSSLLGLPLLRLRKLVG